MFMAWLLCTAMSLHAQTPEAHYAFTGNAKDGSSFANNAAVNGANLTQDRFGRANNAFFFDGVQSGVTARSSQT